jgi:hypothetical protein
MSIWTAVKEPLEGKTSLAKVFWVYGVLGSVAVSAIGLLFDPGNELARRAYVVIGLVFSVYVTIATYQCGVNCRSKAMTRFARISAIITLILLPVLAYLDFTGAIGALINLGEEQ